MAAAMMAAYPAVFAAGGVAAEMSVGCAQRWRQCSRCGGRTRVARDPRIVTGIEPWHRDRLLTGEYFHDSKPCIRGKTLQMPSGQMVTGWWAWKTYTSLGPG